MWEMGDKSWVVEDEEKACAKVLSKKCIDGEGKDLLPSLSNKGVLDKKEHRRRGRASLEKAWQTFFIFYSSMMMMNRGGAHH